MLYLLVEGFKNLFILFAKKLKLVLKYTLLIVLAFASLSFQQQGFDPSAKVKAVFLYNFTKYFEWPKNMKSGNFIIQIIGANASLNQELNRMATLKQIGNQKLEIRISQVFDGSTQPHIVFLLSEASDKLKEIVAKTKGKGTLIVTEKLGMAKAGSSINFVIIDNKQKFEYSKENALKAGLKTSDELKSLAIAVD